MCGKNKTYNARKQSYKLVKKDKTMRRYISTIKLIKLFHNELARKGVQYTKLLMIMKPYPNCVADHSSASNFANVTEF